MKKLNTRRCRRIIYRYFNSTGLFPPNTNRISWRNIKIKDLNLDPSNEINDGCFSKQRVSVELQNLFYEKKSLIPLPLKTLENTEMTLRELAEWCYDNQGISSWIPWSERNVDFAPVVALHPRELFHPTSVETLLCENCEFLILIDTGSKGPIYGKVAEFDNASFEDRCNLLLHPKFNNPYLFPHITLHQDSADIKASMKIQEKYPTTHVYVRGFRDSDSDEAYITYWFFYLENFQPDRFNDEEIQDKLGNYPDDWWTHQGDWEGISLHFGNYRDDHPMEVTFSQHTHYETIPWKETKKLDGRVLAVSALGSHATYNESVSKNQMLFWTEKAQLNLDNMHFPDFTDFAHSKYKLEEFDPYTKHPWLRFQGRWGKSGGEATKAPTGPLMKTKRGFLLLADRQILNMD